ncbi:MAG: hypothetical protein ACE5GX_13135 [Thermoanaerobaculia bacterium]
MNCAGAIASGLLVAVAAPSTVIECLDQLVPYEKGWLADRTSRLVLEGSAGGSLVYLGAEHTRDPSHRQFERWRYEAEMFGPTVVFYEGHDTRTPNSPHEGVRVSGESAYVRWLARQASARVLTLEPTIRQEIDHVRDLFSDEEVQLHYVLREAMLLNKRTGVGEPRVREMIARILRGEHLTEFPRVLGGVDDLESAFRRRWAFPLAWWNPPEAWFNPATSGRSGGVVTRISRAAAAFRDRVMVEKILEEVGRGERVFAVVGRGHLPMQAPALRCALEGIG